MRERVEMLGGTLERRNQSGTTLTITLPMKEIIAQTRGAEIESRH
jgi:glucose-6-phosphate-specific signal transduction histidine kinase